MPGFLLLLSLVIALAFYLFLPPERIARTLYFPGTTSVELTGERRLVPRAGSRQKAIELVVEDLLLGPVRISHSRAFPRDTRVGSVVLDDDVVYIDLTEAAILDSQEVHVGMEIGLDALRKSVANNFRFLETVVVTIDGNVPFAPAYLAVGR